MTKQEKEGHVQAIVERLNGMRFADANEILDTAKDRALGALKIILPVHEDGQEEDITAVRKERLRRADDVSRQTLEEIWNKTQFPPAEVLDELLGNPKPRD